MEERSLFTAYVDESGNHVLDSSKEGTSEFYIVCAIVISDEKLDESKKIATAIKDRYFPNGEIKSSRVKRSNPQRRIKILNEINKIDFKIICAAINKLEILPISGLQYKKSFIKYTTNILYKTLYSSYPSLTVYADEHGDEEFISSFKSYIETKNIKDLLESQSTFTPCKSHEQVLVQIADFYAGTLAQIYEKKCSAEDAATYLELTKQKSIHIFEWPPKLQSSKQIRHSPSSEFDEKIYKYAIKSAYDFLASEPSHPDENERLQLSIIKYLLAKRALEHNTDYISTAEIDSHIKSIGLPQVDPQTLRSNGIAKLRDKNVVIVSSSTGYKIPNSLTDISDFTSRVSSQVVPLLERLKKMQQFYELHTHGTIKILDNNSAMQLKKLINSIDSITDRIDALISD
jgi:hypothetical protein